MSAGAGVPMAGPLGLPVRGAVERPAPFVRPVALAAEAAFEALYKRVYPSALRLARRLVGQAAAEDVVQNVFLRIWKRIEDGEDDPVPFHDAEHAQAIVLKGVINEATTLRRGMKRFRDGIDGFSHELAAVVRSWMNPFASAESAMLSEVMERAIASLPTRCATAFVLRAREDLSYETIATAMSVSPATVHQHLIRANKLLRKYLEAYAPEGIYAWGVPVRLPWRGTR